jgi:hypothetical protein
MATTSKRMRMEDVDMVDVSTPKDKHDPKLRAKEMKLLFLLADAIATKIGVTYDAVIDIENSNLVSGILSSVFTFLRKRANLVAKERQAGVAELETEYERKAITFGVTTTNVKDFAMSLIEGTEKYEFNYMIATPLMNMVTSFKLVWTEARLGTSKFSKGKDLNGKPIKVDIKTYGLNATHLPWLTGITYPPERRTGLMKCLGALTLAINLVNHKDYQDKALIAFNNAISHLDANGEIGRFLSKARLSELASVLPKLGDVLHLVGERSHRKMSFPLFALMRAYAANTTLFEEGNFSSIGGYRTYDEMQKFEYAVRTNSMSADHVRQCLFHAMFGTIFEDLGVLAEVTNVAQWYQRSDLDLAFQKTTKNKTQAALLNVKGLIQFRKYSKLVSSNITPFGAGTLPQYMARHAMAGLRNRHTSKEFKDYMSGGGQNSVFGATAHSIEAQLDARKKVLMDMIENKLNAGTVGWATGYVRDAATNKWVWEGVTQDIVNESGVYVYGINKKLAT